MESGRKKVLPSLESAKKPPTLAPLDPDIFPSKQRLRRKPGHLVVPGSSGGVGSRVVEAPAGFSTHSNPLAAAEGQAWVKRGDEVRSSDHKPRERGEGGKESEKKSRGRKETEQETRGRGEGEKDTEHRLREKGEGFRDLKDRSNGESGRRHRHADGEGAKDAREASPERPRAHKSGHRRRDKERGDTTVEGDDRGEGVQGAAKLEYAVLPSESEGDGVHGSGEKNHARRKKERKPEAVKYNRDSEGGESSYEQQKSRSGRKKEREKHLDGDIDNVKLREGADEAVPSQHDHDTKGGPEEMEAVDFDERAMQASVLVYNEETGQLSSNLTGGAVAASQVDLMKKRIYVEGSTDGYFHRIGPGREGAAGLLGWLYPRGRQPPPPASPDAAAGTDVEGRVLLQVMWDQAGSVLGFVSVLSQCLLGGFALLNLYMTYLLEIRDLPGGFLHYYSAVAVSCQRTYLALTSISLLSACDQYAKDKLTEWRPRGRIKQQRHDSLLILAYLLAFVLSIVGSPFEDVIYYSNLRVPGWYEEGMVNKSFERNLSLWHALNFVRLVACGSGFLLLVHDINARKVDTAVKVKAQIQEEKSMVGGELHSTKERIGSPLGQHNRSKAMPFAFLQKSTA